MVATCDQGQTERAGRGTTTKPATAIRNRHDGSNRKHDLFTRRRLGGLLVPDRARVLCHNPRCPVMPSSYGTLERYCRVTESPQPSGCREEMSDGGYVVRRDVWLRRSIRVTSSPGRGVGGVLTEHRRRARRRIFQNMRNDGLYGSTTIASRACTRQRDYDCDRPEITDMVFASRNYPTGSTGPCKVTRGCNPDDYLQQVQMYVRTVLNKGASTETDTVIQLRCGLPDTQVFIWTGRCTSGSMQGSPAKLGAPNQDVLAFPLRIMGRWRQASATDESRDGHICRCQYRMPRSCSGQRSRQALASAGSSR